MADLRGEGESQAEDPAPAAPAPSEAVEVAQEDPQPDLESDREPAAISTGGFSEPQLSDAIVRGEPVPYQIFVPQAWQTRRSANALNIRFNGHTYFHCSGSQEISGNNAYVRKELNRVLAGNPDYKVAKQEVVTMDRKPWAKLQLMNSRGDQIVLITHGGNRGCYTVELGGSFKQLNGEKAQLDRMISSFKFPPTTYFLAQLDAEE